MALVLQLERDQPERPAEAGGYADPSVQESVLTGILPYRGYFAPFPHGITARGVLVVPGGARLVALSRRCGVRPMLHLSTLTEDSSFSSERAGGAAPFPRGAAGAGRGCPGGDGRARLRRRGRGF